MNPWAMLGILIVALALFGGGYKAGSHNADNACVAGQAKGVQAAQATANTETSRREVIAAKRETSREEIRVVYKTIKDKADENVKQNPAYSTCGLDADGLRQWNAANSGSAQGVSGEPYLSMHRAATGQVWAASGSAEQPHRSDGDVQGLPGQAGEAGGVRK
ncbi:MAG: hypothetical protein PHH47_12945 [Gallionella sp.]|nr:hypothetical protein [Gallionella sp.]MDD4947595.1 hypothetical protein [Gallionella sp.]MDD5612887.1 hypothetical protein [Gallionella sp.]